MESKNRRFLIGLLGVSVVMVGVSYAFVPLYRWFCQVTGFGGTTQRADISQVPAVSEEEIAVRFNADINRELLWDFYPEVKRVETQLGQTQTVYYKVKNLTSTPVAGIANFNVTPLIAGQYFHKITCFCFTEQALEPQEEKSLEVLFYVDPALAEDPDIAHIDTITLSYTFYPVDSPALFDDMIPPSIE